MQFPRLGFPAALAAVTLGLSATLAPARAETMLLLTNQGEREAIVLPSRQGPAPTILVLHGALSTASSAAESSGFAEVAAAHGFTAVFPQGIRKQWNDSREAQAAGVDDVGSLHRLVPSPRGRRPGCSGTVFTGGRPTGRRNSIPLALRGFGIFRRRRDCLSQQPGKLGRARRAAKATAGRDVKRPRRSARSL